MGWGVGSPTWAGPEEEPAPRRLCVPTVGCLAAHIGSGWIVMLGHTLLFNFIFLHSDADEISKAIMLKMVQYIFLRKHAWWDTCCRAWHTSSNKTSATLQGIWWSSSFVPPSGRGFWLSRTTASVVRLVWGCSLVCPPGGKIDWKLKLKWRKC